MNINPQKAQLRKGVDILVCTPGRLLDHVGQKTVDLSQIEIFVLDEADRMLDMGFIHDIRKVLALLPDNDSRQNLLFSATFSNEINQLADRLLNRPEWIQVARCNTAAELIEQVVYLVDKDRKRELLSHRIGWLNWPQVLVFTRTKHGANRLAQQLEKDGLKSAAIKLEMLVFPEPVPPAIPMRNIFLSIIQKGKEVNLKLYVLNIYQIHLKYKWEYQMQIHV